MSPFLPTLQTELRTPYGGLTLSSGETLPITNRVGTAGIQQPSSGTTVRRTLDLGYLLHAPELAFWRVGNEVFFQWKADEKENGVPVWVRSEGKICISAACFENAVFRFCEELLTLMEQRVRTIQQNGWERTDCMLDVDELAKEQMARRESLNDIPHRQQKTDWQQVRTSLDVFLALL